MPAKDGFQFAYHSVSFITSVTFGQYKIDKNINFQFYQPMAPYTKGKLVRGIKIEAYSKGKGKRVKKRNKKTWLKNKVGGWMNNKKRREEFFAGKINLDLLFTSA